LTWYKDEVKDENKIKETDVLNAGKYILVVDIPEIEGERKATKTEVICTIGKAPVSVYDIEVGPVYPGLEASKVELASFFVGKNSSNYLYIYNETEPQLAYTFVSAKDAFTGEAVTTLETDGQYVLYYNVSFTDKAKDSDNYEIKKVNDNATIAIDLVVDAKTYTRVNLQLENEWKDAHYISFDYTGKAPIITDADYTAYVEYYDYATKTYKTLANAQIVGEWYQNGQPMKAAPVESGAYKYRLSYTDASGVYRDSFKEIHVVISEVELTLVPKFDEGVVFYAGTTAEEILAKVDYTLYDAEGIEFAIDRATFWGTQLYNGYTYTYEPVFEVQELVVIEETEEEYYRTLAAEEAIVNEGTYRVIFTGDKAIYDMYYDWEDKYVYNINSTAMDCVDPNYVVDISDDTLEENALDVVITEGAKATIDVSAIFGAEKAGETRENPIKSEFDDDVIYASKNDYKKAVVKAGDTKVAEAADEEIKYTWYRLAYVDLDEEGNEIYYYEPTGPLYLGSPSQAGQYKLVVSYKDKENYYQAENAEVFYTIEPKKIDVTINGEYSAYAGKYISNFIYGTYIDYKFSMKLEDGSVDITIPYDEYDIYWTVEKEVATDEWVPLYEWETFEENANYRFSATDLVLYEEYLATNYALGTSSVVNISIDKLGTAQPPITIKTDEGKIYDKSKVYDGNPIDVEKDIVEGLVTVGEGLEGVSCYWIDEEGYWVEEPTNVGTYTYYVSFGGNSEYAEFYDEAATFTITPKEVTVIPKVYGDAVAGTYTDSDDFERSVFAGVEFDGIVDIDKEYFAYDRFNDMWVGAVDYVDFTVYNKNGGTITLLKGEKTYTIECTDFGINYEWADEYEWTNNYEFVYGKSEFTTVRGISSVSATYVEDTWGDEWGYTTIKESVEGMDHTIVPVNGIPYAYGTVGKFEGGNLIAIKIEIPKEYNNGLSSINALYEKNIEKAGGYIYSASGRYITVVFDASEKDYKEFAIRWEDGYVENFALDLTKVVLEDNLWEAVAPKSISFINTAKKMIVGDRQWLDVKLTKVQEGDIIYLTYGVDNEDVLYVDEYGRAYALKPGKATVTAYPSKLVGDELVPIDGAKTAKVAITVNGISTPKVSKVTPADEMATVDFSKVTDGYRKEVYVLEGKDKTVDQFEEAIASMNNDIWKDIFATEPVTVANYEYNNKTKKDEILTSTVIRGLDSTTDYTVYVRNVRGIKEVDGHFTEFCAAGSVKSFTTTKKQVDSISAYLKKYDKYYYDEILETPVYEVKLSEGSADIASKGFFWHNDGSYYRYDLPLSSDLLAEYENPKLAYSVYDWNGNKTSIVSVNKAGKLTFKNVGYAWVEVYDKLAETGSYFLLKITAEADGMVGKSATLKVGESVDLYDLITYKEGKKALAYNEKAFLTIEEESLKALEASEYFKVNGTRIVAVKEGGNITINVKDANIKDVTASITLKSSALDPAKDFKATMITDSYVVFQFKHTGGAEGFRITLTEGRNKVVSSVYVSADSAVVDYDAKKQIYTYQWAFGGLVKQSKYNVSIVAVYGTLQAKELKKSFKTTLMPASYVVLDKYDFGGVAIVQASYDEQRIDDAYFTTGNVYTVYLADNYDDEFNEYAEYAGTDTLTWTSSNKKVATVKASKDTFGATIAAVGAGYTTIEVKSKITKSVIARYEIYVNPVQAAFDYYGTNEQFWY